MVFIPAVAVGAAGLADMSRSCLSDFALALPLLDLGEGLVYHIEKGCDLYLDPVKGACSPGCFADNDGSFRSDGDH